MDEVVKLTSFTRADKQLIIHGKELLFNGAPIDLESVSAFKYGVEAIRLDMFSIGRKYLIAFRIGSKEFNIVFKCYFGLDRRYFDRIYKSILEEVWESTAIRLGTEAIKTICNKQNILIGKCEVSGKGILYNDYLIEWADLSYQRNYNKLTINSKTNKKVFTNLYYLQEFNIDVLIMIFYWIYQENGLEEFANEPSSNNAL